MKVFNVLKPLLTSLVLFSLAMTADAVLYQSTSGKIDYIYLHDNASNTYGVRIVLKDTQSNGSGYICSEWYLDLSSGLSDQMYAMALSAEAQDKEITLMLRDTSDNLPDSTVCAVHRMFTKKKL